jgi:hypothetical protein
MTSQCQFAAPAFLNDCRYQGKPASVQPGIPRINTNNLGVGLPVSVDVKFLVCRELLIVRKETTGRTR